MTFANTSSGLRHNTVPSLDLTKHENKYKNNYIEKPPNPAIKTVLVKSYEENPNHLHTA